MNATLVRQAGAIVFRTDDQGLRFLIVRAKQNPADWIFPKGHIEPGESAAAAALREAREEAGVDGVVVALVGTSEPFASGRETVCVEYYLVQLSQELGNAERERRWVTIDGALRELTHDDAHQFLQKAVIATAREAHSPAAGPERFSEFLLHEYDHLAASLLANEDSGERRAAFFLTLCAGAAALVGLAIKDKAYLQYPERVLMLSALGVLIILGYSTLLRLVTRNAVSDRYKNQLARLRRYFLSSSSDPNIAFLPFDPFRFRASRPRAIAGLNRGGWVDTMALIVTFLASAFVAVLAWTFMTVPGEPYTPSAVVVSLVAGLIAGATVRPLLSMRGNRVYDRELQEGRDGTVPMKARLKD